ncbi:cysteine desulfurase family protein [Corynebacterium sp. H130]|uniref:cysteine desulfurase family protein n=1 Tax=Corynebacterium sp. H130 TaxID=3133444 RepID=UPI0030A8DAF5
MNYFDHAATSPMRPAAREAWLAASTFNPGGQYALGRAARAAVSEARETIAELLGCEPIEVIFTASGTEADNIAVQGLFRASPLDRVVASPIEHPAVAETVKNLGASVAYFEVAATGHVQVGPELDEPAALVTCMLANNETGAIQPLSEIVAATDAPVHVDAVQAVGHIPVNFSELGVTTLAASAHKFGGPRNGILLAKRSPAPAPILFGGGQERGIRSGTIDVAGAVATAVSLKEAVSEMESEAQRLAQLRDELRECAVSLGGIVHTQEPALPGHLHVSFPGAVGDSLIMLLDMHGIAASTGSACSNGVNRASETLLAMGVTEAQSALRFTLGYTTNLQEVKYLINVLPEVVEQARKSR